MVKAILSAALFCIVLVVFWPVSQFSFLNFDDPTYVTHNPHIVSGLTVENIYWAFTHSVGGHWHPLTWISHMIDCSVFGPVAGPMHIENMIIHASNVVLVFLLFANIFTDRRLAFISALIFGLHPTRLESVAWISERKDVLSMFFGLASIHFYLLSIERPTFLRNLGLYLSFILSLLAKPTFVTLPALLLLLDWWPLRRDMKQALIQKIPLVVISLAMCAVAAYTQTIDGGLKTLDAISFSDRMNTVWLGYGAYLGKFFAPVSIGLFYPFQRVQPGFGVGASLGILAVTALIFDRREKHPWLVMGWGWFIVSLLPMIGILPIGGQSYADRWSYLPHLGLLMGGALFLKKETPRATLPLLCSFAVFCLVLTRLNLPHWKDSISIFTHTLEISPDNFMAHTNLGTAYDAAGKLDKAKPHFEEALRLNPTYPEALNNVGRIRASEGRLVDAQELFSKALSINPGLIVARYNLGLVFSQLQKPTLALSEWITILTQAPEHSGALQSIRYTLSTQRETLCASIHRGAEPELYKQVERWNPSPYSFEVKNSLLTLIKSC